MAERTESIETAVEGIVTAAIARQQTESVLEQILGEWARRLLKEALELEVPERIERFQDLRSGHGQRLVVRNGHLPERTVLTASGPVAVRQPRVADRRPGERYTSAILPPYLRRTPSLDALVPALYLSGVSTSAFPEALEAILGKGVGVLSPANVARLKQVWEQEFVAWSKHPLDGRRCVYWWADAVVRHEAPCSRVGCKDPPVVCRSRPRKLEAAGSWRRKGRWQAASTTTGRSGTTRQLRAWQARRQGVTRSEPVVEPPIAARQLKPGGYGLARNAYCRPQGRR